MAQVTLPAGYTEADVELAERLGQELDLEAVHVFWTLPPDPPLEGGRRTVPGGGLVGGAIAAVGGLLARLIPRG